MSANPRAAAAAAPRGQPGARRPARAPGPLPEVAAALAEAASLAGALLLASRARLDPFLKDDGSLCTRADVAADALLRRHLARALPGLPLVTEEHARRGATGGAFLLVDPLDGTREYAAGGIDFAVCVALVDGGRPVAGALYAPAMQRLWLAGGGGAEELVLDPGEPLRAARARRAIRARDPGPAIEALASASHGGGEDGSGRTAAAFARALGAGPPRRLGSAVKFGLIARGDADLYVRPGRTMEWDTAAGEAVLAAAGGLVTDLSGRPLAYGKRARGFENDPFVAWGSPRLLERARGLGLLSE